MTFTFWDMLTLRDIPTTGISYPLDILPPGYPTPGISYPGISYPRDILPRDIPTLELSLPPEIPATSGATFDDIRRPKYIRSARKHAIKPTMRK